MGSARVAVLGSRGAFTAAALSTLIERRIEVAGLVVPGPPGPPRQVAARPSLVAPEAPSAVDHALAAGLRVLEIGGLESDARAAVGALQPDVMVLACFPWLLPQDFRDLPEHACVNVHPSLLPLYRGPVPLFWQFRDGAPGGVTVHHVEGGVDTGDVIAQAPITYASGTRTHEADTLAASSGARLLADLLALGGEWPRRAQAAGGSRQGLPTAESRVIPRSWTARRAFDFIRGAGAWGPFVIEGEPGHVHDAKEVVREGAAGEDHVRLVSFSDAFLHVV